MSVLLATLLSISATTAPVVSSPTFVQDETPQTNRRYQSLEHLLEIPLTMDVSAAARIDALDEKKAPEGPTATIQDFIVSETGAIQWASVACGGFLGIGDRVVLVPIERLNHEWKEDKLTCELRMTKDELKGLPEFDAAKAKKKGGLQRLVMIAEASYRDDSKKSDDKVKEAKDVKGTAREATTPKQFFATDMCALNVRGNDAAFGTVTNCVVDMRTKSVNALLVSHGGALGVGDTIRVLPFEVATFGFHEKEVCVQFDKTAKQLESSVEFEKSEKCFIKGTALETARAFFGLRSTEK